jgi:hypothetical protein
MGASYEWSHGCINWIWIIQMAGHSWSSYRKRRFYTGL